MAGSVPGVLLFPSVLSQFPVTYITGTAYTLTAEDALAWLRTSSADPVTVTVPPQDDAAFPAWATIYVQKGGDGDVTIAAGAGVTIQAIGSLVITNKYARVELKRIALNLWTATIVGGSSSGGASAFTDLSDVPASYVGQALRLLRVNAGESGVEFHALAAADITDSSSVGRSILTAADLAAVKVILAYTAANIANVPAGGIAAATVQAAIDELDSEKQTAAQVSAAVSAAIAALSAVYQPLDADLTAIAALATTAYGRSVLTQADAAALRTLAGLGGLAVLSSVTASLISDASANGRSLITAADFAAMRTLLALVPGTDVQAFDADLAALAALASTGLLARTGAGTVSARTLTGPAAGLTVTAGDGVAGNPTLALADDLAALEAMAGTGLVARTAANTYAQRTIGLSGGLSGSNLDGVAGAPALTIADAALTLAKLPNVSPRRLLGNAGTVAAAPSEIAQGPGLQFRGNRLRASYYPDTIGRKMLQAQGWAARTSAADNDFRNIAYSQELGIFVAVSVSGVGNRVMYSVDGGVWATATTPADNNWQGVCWAPEVANGAGGFGLFVAVAGSGTGNRVMTSPDGVTWTIGVSSADNDWRAVCWSGALTLFVAVSASGTGTRVMTSPDGTTWTTRTSAANLTWNDVCWSPELGLFAAIAQSGTGTRVMTSSDGTTWTSRTSASDNNWNGVCWAAEIPNGVGTYGLFVAVAITGTGNRVMTSPDGITWTSRTSAADNAWRGVVWAREIGLLMAVAATGTGNRAMYSRDGVNWVIQTSGADNSWYGVAWAGDRGIFATVAFSGTGNRVMTIAHEYGIYTPTLTNVANLAASVASALVWFRAGTRVTVFGKVNVDPTAAATTQLGMSLPIASTVATDSQIAGSGAAKAVAGMSVAVIGDTVNNRAQFEWVAVDLAARDVHFSFSYVVR